MAYDYNNYKKFYEAMNESQRAKWTESNKNDADFKDFYSRYTSSTPTTNTTKNQTSNSTNWSNTTYKDSDWYYSATDRNAATWWAEFWSTTTPKTTTNNSNATRVSWTTPTTTTTTTTPKTTTTTTPTTTTNSDKIWIIRDGWNQLTYEQQQEKLKATPWLKENLIRYGITSKTNPATDSLRYGEWQYKYNPNSWYYEKVGQGNQTNQTPTNKGGWDYQDNSPERMTEIIDNLDRISKSNPWLFSDYDTFYNAFIAGKWRTPEQEEVINDYFNKMKQYNKYDNKSSDEMWYLLAHWEPAEDYLSYLKYNDPQRYAEIQESREKNENQIMNETYLNTVASQAGYEMWDSDFWKWNQEEMWYRDANKDWLDDRLYHAPTEEELKLVDENNQYEQERAKLTDAYKWLQEDLTNQYPDADLSTIMLLTSDRWNKIQRALDTLAVNQSKVQWSLKYLQNERATMDDAWQKTINEIQKQYGMYYDYSPQWIAERAQAEYAATNVTLDQADNGTDTQKQMALDRVLSDYYDKYGSIIQRSKSQVINDVMNYAKKNGVSLSQALENNFLKFLRQKPEYATLSSGWSLTADKWAKLNDNTLYNVTTWEIMSANWYLWGWTNYTWGLYWFTDYTPITKAQKESTLDNFMEQRKEGSEWWECGEFVNDYLEALWYDRLYDDPIDKKKAVTNSDTATKWSIAVLDSKKYPQYWHVAIVTDVQWDKVKLLESNWNDDHKVHTTRWVNKSDIAWYFDPSKSSTTPQDVLNNKFTWDPDWNQNWYFNWLVPYFNSLLKDWKIDLTDTKYKEKRESYWITDKEFDQMAQNYANTELLSTWAVQSSRALESAMKAYKYLYWPESWKIWRWPNWNWETELWRALWWYVWGTDANKAKKYVNTMLNRLTLKELFDAKALWATFWAMSKDEWEVLANAATEVSWDDANFKENLEDLIESLYTATIDGKAALPKWWEDSAAWDMVRTRIANWTALWNYDNVTVAKSSTSNNNWINNPYWNNQDKYDDEWNS